LQDVLIAAASGGRNSFGTIDGRSDTDIALHVAATIDMNDPGGTPDVLGHSSSSFRGQGEGKFDGLAKAHGVGRFEGHAALRQIDGIAGVRHKSARSRDFAAGSNHAKFLAEGHKSDRHGAGFPVDNTAGMKFLLRINAVLKFASDYERGKVRIAPTLRRVK
jgi:hypothetical protein